MKKYKYLMIICVVLVIFVLFLTTGRARTDVYLTDFEVSKDGDKMTLKVNVSSSAGYIRKIKRTSGSTNGYYTFYSTYGINSKIGAKDTFEIELDENMDEIYFYTADKGYKLVLAKYFPTQEWQMIRYADVNSIKIDLPNKEDILNIGINTMAQDNNYFQFNDKKIIDNIYNILFGLETNIPSITVNPDGAEEIYAITFDTDENQEIVEYYIEIYRKNNRYYVEQRYNGIYEITENEFNSIKNYIIK